MDAILILKIAAVLALIEYTAHAILFLTSKVQHGPVEVSVVEAMKSEQFNFGLRPKSYWEMYFGYGLLAVLPGLVEIAFLWLIAPIAESNAASVKPMIMVLLAFNVLHAALVWRYFTLLPPLVFDGLIAVCLGWALLIM